MLQTEVKAKLNLVFRDVFDDEAIQITEAMTAADIEDWDSLTHVQLISAVEKAFGVKFTVRESQTMKNVGEFIELITRRAP
jgi:acyl carrier protein